MTSELDFQRLKQSFDETAAARRELNEANASIAALLAERDAGRALYEAVQAVRIMASDPADLQALKLAREAFEAYRKVVDAHRP